jgi:chemotaxis protein methyltransferase CheR
MTTRISAKFLAQLEQFVARRLGLHFPKERHRNLARGVAIAAKELAFEDPASFVEMLLASPATDDQLDILTSALTVGETYFFREKRIFEILEQHLLPQWITTRRATSRALRIWSAGCCTGEEAYSVAILIRKMIPDLASWRITILATDINRRFLEKASAGTYSEWSFRGTPGWVKERYFKRKRDGRYELDPEIREMVKFTQLNLAENGYPSAINLTTGMDLILCRNVLMYFIPWQVNKVLDSFYRCLLDEGWLIVSPTEISYLQALPFSLVKFPGAMLHQKQRAQGAAPKAPVASLDFYQVSANDERCFMPPWAAPKNAINHGPEALPVLPPQAPRIVPGLPPEPRAVGQQLDISQPPDSPSLSHPGSDLLALYEEGRYAELTDKLSGWLSHCRAESESPGCGYDPFVLLVKCYANLGNLDMALTWCDQGIARSKLNPSLRYLRAVILQERGEPEAALAALRQAIYLDPHFILGHFALGNVTLKLGRAAESEKHFANTMSLLNGLNATETVPESDGMTVGALLEMVRRAMSKEKTA